MNRADDEGAVFDFWETGRNGKGAILVRHTDHAGTDARPLRAVSAIPPS